MIMNCYPGACNTLACILVNQYWQLLMYGVIS